MSSPAQLLYSRNLKPLLPTSKCQLKPQIVKYDQKYFDPVENIKKYYYNHVNPLPELSVGKIIFKIKLDMT